MVSFHLSKIKIRISARPFGTNSQWITPSKFHETHNIIWGPNKLFQNDDFGRLTGDWATVSRSQVYGNRPIFFITCDNFPDKSIIHGITDKLTTDIHSALSCWGVNSWGTDLQVLYDFPRVLIWRCTVSFDAPSSSDRLRVLFADFSTKLYVYSQYPII